ncbi:MAG: adaptor protein MecA [Lachnospira sp.]
MKIERLSENQIRCTLNKSDLASRQLKISELAYGSEKARELFRDMMQQASYELGFEADNIPLMIEAIPVSPECIVLIITKVDNPEELDTRFSRFSPFDRDMDDDDLEYDDFPDMETIGQDYSASLPTANEELDNDEYEETESSSTSVPDFLGNDLMNLFGKVRDFLNNNNSPLKASDDASKSNGNATETPASSTDKFIPLGKSLSSSTRNDSTPDSNSKTVPAKSAMATRIYTFRSIDDISLAARSITPVFNGTSSLFKDSDKIYYLVINKSDCSSVNFNKTCNILTEYGDKLQSNEATACFLDEHAVCLIKSDAVGVMSKL